MKTKFLSYLILILIVLVFVIVEIAINTNESPEQSAQQEISKEEYDNLYGTEEVAIPEQEVETFSDEGDVSDFAEVEPQFPGGEGAMIEFIQDNVRYPELSREMGEQGTVYVQFVVNTDGSIQNVRVLKGVSELLDQEAMRVIKKMPDWSPGMQNGEAIRVRYQIPIKFSIA